MKFWKWLAWLCSAAFLAIVLGCLFGNYHRSNEATPDLNEPPPAPVFR